MILVSMKWINETGEIVDSSQENDIESIRMIKAKQNSDNNIII